MVVMRFEVYLINLNSSAGSEIQKTHPCLIISPDEMNRHIATVMVAPMTRKEEVTQLEWTASLIGRRGRLF